MAGSTNVSVWYGKTPHPVAHGNFFELSNTLEITHNEKWAPTPGQKVELRHGGKYWNKTVKNCSPGGRVTFH